MKLKIFLLAFVVLLIAAGYACVKWYTYIFAKTVRGTVMNIERVTQATIITSPGTQTPAQMWSFAIMIRAENSQEIYVASTEDRKWDVITKGTCVQAKIFPSPPWEIDKGGGYTNAQLQMVYDCPK
jgi:hypothetical protein